MRSTSPVLAWTVAVGVFVLAGSSFALSFNALAELAVASGVPEHLAFLWPVIVDGFIVVATLAAFSFSSRPGRVQLYPWLALGLFAIVSVAGNALHVQTLAPGVVTVTEWIAVTVASVPPVALLIASHLLVVMISGQGSDAPVPAAQPEPAPINETAPVEQPLEGKIPRTVRTLPPSQAAPVEPVRVPDEQPRVSVPHVDPPVVPSEQQISHEAEYETGSVEAPVPDLADFLQVPERFSASTGARVDAPAPASSLISVPVVPVVEERAQVLAQASASSPQTRTETAPSPDLDAIRAHHAEGGELTAKSIAALLNVSERTGRRKLSQYREAHAS